MNHLLAVITALLGGLLILLIARATSKPKTSGPKGPAPLAR